MTDRPTLADLGGSITGRPIAHFVGRADDGTWQWIDNPLTADDIQKTRQRLEALRPQFDALGRGEWMDHSLAMLDQLAAHAKGTASIYDGEDGRV